MNFLFFNFKWNENLFVIILLLMKQGNLTAFSEKKKSKNTNKSSWMKETCKRLSRPHVKATTSER